MVWNLEYGRCSFIWYLFLNFVILVFEFFYWIVTKPGSKMNDNKQNPPLYGQRVHVKPGAVGAGARFANQCSVGHLSYRLHPVIDKIQILLGSHGLSAATAEYQFLPVENGTAQD